MEYFKSDVTKEIDVLYYTLTRVSKKRSIYLKSDVTKDIEISNIMREMKTPIFETLFGVPVPWDILMIVLQEGFTYTCFTGNCFAEISIGIVVF